MSNRSIQLIDRTLSSATIPSQSEPESDGNEEVTHTPQNWSLTIKLFSVISRKLVGGVSYLAAEKQSVYSKSPADLIPSRLK